MLNNLPNTFRAFKYAVDILTVIINDKIYELDPNFITFLSLEKDFDEDAFPVLQMEFSLNDSLYYEIIKNKENVQFKIRIMKYLYDENNKLRSRTQLINDVFISFIEEETPEIDKKIKSEVSDESLLIANKSLRLFLFKKLDLVNSKNYINGVFKNVTMTELLSYILSTSGIKKVLLSPLHNVHRYDEIRIPPLTVLDTLDYLENVYDGFYNNGSTKFFDYDCMYFIDRGRRNNVYRNDEHTETIITILQPTSIVSNASGCYIDNINRKTYINVSPTAFTPFSNSIVNEHVNGNNAIIISPSTGKVTKIEPPVREMTGNVYKLIVDRYNNKRAISNYTMMLEENDSVINVSTQDVDISALSPNKQFKIIFEDVSLNKNLGGEYRISRLGFIFKKEASEFSVMGDIKFKKIR